MGVEHPGSRVLRFFECNKTKLIFVSLITVTNATKKPKAKHCELCERNKPLSFHHLIPKKNHNRNYFEKTFAKEDMKTRGVWLCYLCHKKLHKTFSEKDLGKSLNTLQSLKEQKEIQVFIIWAKKQK